MTKIYIEPGKAEVDAEAFPLLERSGDDTFVATIPMMRVLFNRADGVEKVREMVELMFQVYWTQIQNYLDRQPVNLTHERPNTKGRRTFGRLR